MRSLRLLKQGVWYQIRTRINNREPLFRRYNALALFAQVFLETENRFVFEVRALCLEDDWLTFYIKPADGLELPAIMKWLKQVFAQRYNWAEGRIGHIWGDRYGSRILEGEPPPAEPAKGQGASADGVRYGAGETNSGGRENSPAGVRPRYGEEMVRPGFPLLFPFPATPGAG
jgi:REP element-mobilizing transposase RayT